MRASMLLVLAVAVPSLPLAAQQSIFIPDNNATAGTCNVIPFGQTPSNATWGNQIYQMLIPASLINAPVLRICDLGWAPCGSGDRTFDRLQIRMDHTMSATLSTTFSANMTAAAVTVLDVKDHVWPNVANTWNRVGLQQDFLYIQPLGNLVIEITVWNSGFNGTAGFHRSSTIERAYAFGWTGSPPGSGSIDLAALKVELVSDTAMTDTYGVGCMGSGGVPFITFSGDSKLGNTLGLQVNSAAASAPVFLALGLNNGNPPFPLLIPATGSCRVYHDQVIVLATATSSSGTASLPLSIPQDPALICFRLYGQYYVLDAPANPLGIAASNYARVVVGK